MVPGRLQTTAMAVMPHVDVERALELALSLDIPFWPQLPNYSYREDMYVQAAEYFPGIILDLEGRTLRFSMDRFILELEGALARMENPALMDVSRSFSTVYHRFCSLDHGNRTAIRGQLEGPVSFGFNILDEDGRPIIFNDTVRQFMVEFLAVRANAQLANLKELNPGAFMFIDEPGLQFLFSAMSGYSDTVARPDLERFFALVDRPRGIHLCGNPDWDFLLGLDLDVLSFDAYANGTVFSLCSRSVSRFLDRGGVIVWGIVPTGLEAFSTEGVDALVARLENIWKALWSSGIDPELMVERSMISPATCCLVNPDGGLTIERAFLEVMQVARTLRNRHLHD